MYSGTAQAAVMNLFAGGETLLFTYLLTFFIVNCRYVLLSISMSQKLDPGMSTLSRMIFAPFNTDEIFVVAMQQKSNLNAPYLFGISIIPYLCMLLGTVLGLIFTNFLPTPVASALGITIYAMLLALVVPPSRKSKIVAIIVALAAGISIFLESNPFVRRIISPGWNVIICAVVTALIGAIAFPVKNSEENEEKLGNDD
jgi:predicted branched-subunit amino acid permease